MQAIQNLIHRRRKTAISGVIGDAIEVCDGQEIILCKAASAPVTNLVEMRGMLDEN